MRTVAESWMAKREERAWRLVERERSSWAEHEAEEIWIMVADKGFIPGWSMTRSEEGRRVHPSWLETRECWEEEAEISSQRLGGAR